MILFEQSCLNAISDTEYIYISYDDDDARVCCVSRVRLCQSLSRQSIVARRAEEIKGYCQFGVIVIVLWLG